VSKVYTALVVDHHDPIMSGRVKVMCPPVYGEDKSVWAPTLIPPDTATTYNEGDIVEIILKGDNPQYPLVLGRRIPYNGDGVPAEFRDFSSGPYYKELRDATEHEPINYDNLDHRKGHEHSADQYWNPYIRGLFWPLGSKFYVSEEPGKQSTRVQDRLGQGLKFEGDPIEPKDPHDEERVGGTYTAPELDDGSEIGQTGWRASTELRGLHGHLLDMRVGNDEKEEELRIISSNTDGDHYGSLTMSNTKLSHANRLIREAGGYTQTLEQVATDETPALNKTVLRDELGNQIEIHSDPTDHWIEVKHTLGHHIKLHMNGDITVESANALERVKLSESSGVEVFTTAGLKVDSMAGVSINATTGISLAAGGGSVTITNATPSTINGKGIAVTGDVTSLGGIIAGTGI